MSLYLKVLWLQISRREICVSQHDTNTPAKPQADLTMLNQSSTKQKFYASNRNLPINFSSTYSKTRQIADCGVFEGFCQDFGVFLRQLTSLPQRNMCLRATETVGSMCSEKMPFFSINISFC